MPDTPSKRYGVAAIGSAGRFDIEIDEAIDSPSEIQMGIATAEWSFRFNLSARTEVARINSFLKEQAGKTVFSESVIGSFLGAPVFLIKDDEFADRFWLRASAAGQVVDFVLAGDDLAEFTDALVQAARQLQS